MYRISELASLVGLSRTALLYYEKLKLISAQRLANGYRVYSDRDVQRIRLIQQLQAGGLTLAECKSCLERKLDKAVLNARYLELENDIKQKQASLALLSALLGHQQSRSWHEKLSEVAPDAHVDWLKVQGYDEKQALRIKWLSKDMNEHDTYMQDFMSVFEALDYWGPNSTEDTTRAFDLLNVKPKTLLEIGCGNGRSTITLAHLSDAHIIATDNEQTALDRLEAKIHHHQLSHRVTTQCLSMTELSFDQETFDVIWAEASAYVMGVQNALSQWSSFLKPKGVLVFSDLVWLTETPSETAMKHWANDYPDMQSVAVRSAQIEQAGYQVLHSFALSEDAWKNYYLPLQARLNEVSKTLAGSQAVADIQHEVDLYKTHLGEFGYYFFIAQKV